MLQSFITLIRHRLCLFALLVILLISSSSTSTRIRQEIDSYLRLLTAMDPSSRTREVGVDKVDVKSMKSFCLPNFYRRILHNDNFSCQFLWKILASEIIWNPLFSKSSPKATELQTPNRQRLISRLLHRDRWIPICVTASLFRTPQIIKLTKNNRFKFNRVNDAEIHVHVYLIRRSLFQAENWNRGSRSDNAL